MFHELLFGLKRRIFTDSNGEYSLLPNLPNIERKYLTLFIELSDNYHFVSRSIEPVSGPLSEGISQNQMYVNAFREGVRSVLDEYNALAAEIEKDLLEHPSISILSILNKISYFHLPLETVRQAILQLENGKVHGCQIVDLCYNFTRYGVSSVMDTFMCILKPCRILLLRQIKSWILYGKLKDPYKEFFIQNKVDEDSFLAVSLCSSVSSQMTHSSLFHDEGYIQMYYLAIEYLPPLVRLSVATKILFIGETVLLFSCNPEERNKDPIPVIDISKYGIDQISVADKFSELENMVDFDTGLFEVIISDVWLSVNKHLRRLAEDVGGLSSQFKFIADIYLLGCGELFQEFLCRANIFLNAPAKSTRSKTLDCALESAAYYVYLSESLDVLNRIYFFIPHKDSYPEKSKTRDVFQLRYKTPWPLHLIFTKEVISNYNIIFKFLLRLKKATIDLSSVWIDIAKIKNSEAQRLVMSVHSQSLCLLKNLENYLFVDVIKGELEVLENVMKVSDTFFEIQKAHSIFQSNILTGAFLLPEQTKYGDGVENISDGIAKNKYSVHLPLLGLFSMCEEFERLMKSECGSQITFTLMTVMQNNLESLVEHLISLASGPNVNTSSCHNIYNLILRLDYNSYFRDKFSERVKKKKKVSKVSLF